MAWEDVKPILRPEGVHMGIMKVDKDLCTGCGLCIQNCPFSAWEMGGDDHPVLKEKHDCFSCYNCMVVCPVDALSIQESYHVDSGYWASEPNPIPARMPMEARDKDGNPTEWNAIERAIFERRSVRNFKEDPVPESLIRRVLEAGRFAPSAGNCQPWKFIVVTDKSLIKEMDTAIYGIISGLHGMYMNDQMIQGLVPIVESNPNTGTWDPRQIIGGSGAISRGALPPSLAAPAIIIIAGDTRAITGPQLNIGICGQNMNLVANSLGIKACWIGFYSVLNMVPPLFEKLGLKPPWQVISSMVLGWPKFKQEGIVPREFRPVTWFRPGADGPVEETGEGFESV
ncbi:MAG: nitroreductase family protein [Thermodesulfobacteriota bacterium]